MEPLAERVGVEGLGNEAIGQTMQVNKHASDSVGAPRQTNGPKKQNRVRRGLYIRRAGCRCEANSSMPARSGEVWHQILFGVFPSVEDFGNAIHDFDDETPSFFWCQVLCDEVLVNPQTARCLGIARSFDFNHNPGHHH